MTKLLIAQLVRFHVVELAHLGSSLRLNTDLIEWSTSSTGLERVIDKNWKVSKTHVCARD